MRYVFGAVFAVGLLLAPASRANAQVAVSVGYPGYYGYGYPGYGYPGGYYGGFGGVSINVPGFSFYSGSYSPPVYAAPVAAAYTPGYYAPYYGVGAPYAYTSGYYGYYPGVRLRVGY